MAYVSIQSDHHTREEEQQWARIMAQGDPVKGVVLVLLQKLCTALHELEPAWREHILTDAHLSFVKERLTSRFRTVLHTAEANNLGEISGMAELSAYVDKVENVSSLSEVFAWTEDIHAVTHKVTDAIEELPSRK